MRRHHLQRESMSATRLVSQWLQLGILLLSGTLWADDNIDFFETKIRPVLVEHCYACHSSTAASKKKLRGNLLLDSRGGSQRGGESGPAVVPGKPEASLLLSALRYESFQMPPGGKLSEQVIANFVKWIEMGAPDPRSASDGGHSKLPSDQTPPGWAFQPPQQPPLPPVKQRNWSRGVIDQLVLANLENHGMQPAPAADKQTLLRRATYDLLGLPPTATELEDFLADDRPQAFDEAVTALLNAPDFGIRWARHWLDNVRYAEDDPTCAANNNGSFSIAPYRDWVVDSFNRDLPYDAFVRLQVAGDLIPKDNRQATYAERLTATGIWGLAHLIEGNDREKVVADFVDEQLDVLGRTFLGLTISCARCHDHKFDPITQEEYYALAGIFYSSHIFTFPGSSARTRRRVQQRLLESPAAQLAFTTKQARLKTVSAAIKAIEKQHGPALALKNVRRDLAAITRQELPPDPETRKGKQWKERVKRVQELRQKETELVQDQQQKNWDPNPAVLQQHPALVTERDRLKQEVDAVPLRMVMQEGPVPNTRHQQIGDLQLFLRGNHLAPGPLVPRGFPAVLASAGGTAAELTGSGRLQLANWLTRTDNPLTARVMANRIWQHLFGVGIVATPSNFGKLGQPPTHPELLDLLAIRLVKHNWSVKALIREIMTSSTYRQTSIPPADSLSRDPENRHFGRMHRKRLDAEALKDTLLSHTGVVARATTGGLPQSGRALYDKASRDKPQTMLGLFDGADPDLVVPRREDSTSATQALFMLNNPLALKTAVVVAEHIIAATENEQTRVALLYQRLFGRPPSHQEQLLATDVLNHARSTRQRLIAAGQQEVDLSAGPWHDFCMALLCSNEFLYLD
ncbi:MAG: PSD1 and planctomycete cytochrome C domain-containing protein [Planctomycetota bacterium]|nr:PSD1 and planctomycete cytochrome C domain-containing protein [Planctomycetota bacterium]